MLEERDSEPLLPESKSAVSYGSQKSESNITLGANNVIHKRSRAMTQLSQRTQPITLAWQNVEAYGSAKVASRSCFSKTKIQRTQYQGPTHILKNVSGVIESGQLVALMGASGAGKTTLLNILTGRNTRGLDASGSITCNGQEIGRAITAVSAYVQQDDLFIGTLTVREHLIFQAALRLPQSMSLAEKILRSDAVLFDLGLTKCKDTKIGVTGVFRGISGGEAKRLAFASEILTNPAILFCDEPTTGLDSFMAENIVHVLQKLARQGKTVLCTIHQPASEVYNLFNKVYYLAEGRTAFYGEPKEVLSFFKDAGFFCPPNYNAADFIIQLLSIVPGVEGQCIDSVNALCDKYEESSYMQEIKKKLQRLQRSNSTISFNETEIFQTSPYKNGFHIQFIFLLWRALLSNYRNRNVALAKIGQKLILGLFIGLMYTSTKYNQAGIMSYSGALFFIVMEFTFPATFGVINTIPEDFNVLVREHHNGMYKVTSFYLARIASFIPVYSLDGVVFMIIAYFLAGLREGAAPFFICLIVALLIAQVSVSFGVMLSCITPNFTLALVIAGPFQTLIQMAGGLFTNINTLPIWLRWIQWVSWFRYGYEAFMINQWQGLDIECETPELACVRTGEEVLENSGFHLENFGLDIGLLFANMFLFYSIGLIGILIRVYRAR